MEYKIINYQTLGSTNELAKSIASQSPEGTVIVAEEQSQGKGRLGRSWLSPRGKGLWMSIILKPSIAFKDLPKITLIGAASVNMTLSEMGIDSLIKWPNDIVINGKKICGILTEVKSNMSHIKSVIIGIGININQDLVDIPRDLRHRASSLKIIKGEEINRDKVLEELLDQFKRLYLPFKLRDDISEAINICRKKSSILGKEVFVLKGKGGKKLGLALDLDREGRLLVDYGNGPERLYSGEVSIRGLEAYSK